MGMPTTITLIVREGKLINYNIHDKVKMDRLMSMLKEGDLVEATYEIKNANASYAQMSKLHASIRLIAEETGSGFNEVKLEMKRRCGLVIGDKVKSFGDCSKAEISKVIEECISVAETLNINLH